MIDPLRPSLVRDMWFFCRERVGEGTFLVYPVLVAT
jgi:hypothetical protein